MDAPEDMVHMRYKDYGRLLWSYYYGTQDVALRETSLLCGVRSARTAQLGTFIHPVLQYTLRTKLPYYSPSVSTSLSLARAHDYRKFWYEQVFPVRGEVACPSALDQQAHHRSPLHLLDPHGGGQPRAPP